MEIAGMNDRNAKESQLLNIEIKSNLYQLYTIIARENRFLSFQAPEYSWVSPKPYVWPAFIYDSKITVDDLKKLEKNLITKMRNNVAPNFWIVCIDEFSDFLETFFDSNGLRLAQVWPGMLLELKYFLTDNDNTTTNFRVRKINNKEDLQKWARIIDLELYSSKGFSYKPFLPFLNKDNFSFYLGEYNGVPVASSMGFFNGNSVGLYMISTLSQYRGKGFGKEITKAPLIEGKKRGYKFGVLQASKMGLSIYQKIGFSELNKFLIFWLVSKDYKV
jgi:hypothetical protein